MRQTDVAHLILPAVREALYETAPTWVSAVVWRSAFAYTGTTKPDRITAETILIMNSLEEGDLASIYNLARETWKRLGKALGSWAEDDRDEEMLQPRPLIWARSPLLTVLRGDVEGTPVYLARLSFECVVQSVGEKCPLFRAEVAE